MGFRSQFVLVDLQKGCLIIPLLWSVQRIQGMNSIGEVKWIDMFQIGKSILLWIYNKSQPIDVEDSEQMAVRSIKFRGHRSIPREWVSLYGKQSASLCLLSLTPTKARTGYSANPDSSVLERKGRQRVYFKVMGFPFTLMVASFSSLPCLFYLRVSNHIIINNI
jgi:hypothetical protein